MKAKKRFGIVSAKKTESSGKERVKTGRRQNPQIPEGTEKKGTILKEKSGERLLKMAEWIRGPEFYKNSRAASEIALLYPGKAGQVRLRRFYGEKLWNALCLFLAGSLLSVLAVVLQPKVLSPEAAITRSSYDDRAQSVHLLVKEESGDSFDLTAEVSARRYTSGEAEEVLKQVKQKLDTRILGENRSLFHVQTDLDLIRELDGVSIVWESGNYHTMDMNGHILTEEIPAEGLTFHITGHLSLEDQKDIYEREITVVPPGLTEEEAREKAYLEAVQEADVSQIHTPLLKLPEEVNGVHVEWKEPSGGLLPALLLLVLLMTAAIYWNEDQKLHAQLVQRAGQMDADYAEIVNKLVLLLGAGMTIRGAWTRIAEEYAANKKEERFAYEEMLLSLNELQRGIPELQVYEHFGRRCANASYLKLSALLTQNLRKGTKGLLELFRREASESLRRQKNMVRKRGEEAGTKLLLPMFLMLAVVLMIVMIPAFLSMQI